MKQLVKKGLNIGLAILIVAFAGLQPARAQDFDFQKRPTLSVDYRHLDLDLSVTPEPLQLSGQAVYQFESRIDSVKELTLQAAHMDINGVEVDGQTANYEIHNDTLQVMLAAPVMLGEEHALSINYSTEPRFGVLKDRFGAIWSSMLPRSNEHWLPVVDHPRVQFTVNMNLTIPTSHNAVATGSRQGSEIKNVDEKVVRYISNKPVAATDLFFASGPFDVSEQAYGPRTLRLFCEKGLLSQEQQNNLRQQAYDKVRRMERALNFEFPWPALNVVVLADHHWETKAYGASTVILYKNMGNLSGQLDRGLTAQWFGSWQRDEQWLSNQATLLHQQWLLDQVGLLDSTRMTDIERPDMDQYVVYDAFGPDIWNRWMEYWNTGMKSLMKAVINRTAREQVKRAGGVYTWDDYADLWYDRSGQPWFDAPNPRGDTDIDSLVYKVNYHPADDGKSLSLGFHALSKRYAGELVNARLYKVEGSDTTSTTVTFTGQQDSIVVETTPMLQTAWIKLPADRGPLRFEENKPLSFLVYQLRNGTTANDRAKAAHMLEAYAESPDLQLALQDVLRNEDHPKVVAAIYKTLGAVMKGDTGTQQTFLDVLRKDYPEVVKKAAITSLGYYPENDQARRTIERYATDLTHPQLAEAALEVLPKVEEPGAFRQTAAEILRADSTLTLTPKVLWELEKSGQQSAVVTHAQDYLGSDLPYSLRSEALKMLLKYDNSAQNWEPRIKRLINDSDPRIRYLSWRAVDRLTSRAARSLLESNRMEEYDVRVLIRINKLMQSKP